MDLPYMICPFMNEVYNTELQRQPAQQYPQQFMPGQQQQYMPMQQFPQQYLPGQQYQQQIIPMQYFPMQGYPMQFPATPYGDTDTEDMGPATHSPGDPPPIVSNNPVTASITLFKELTGYNNYGNPSRNADILYTGNRGTWTFESPAFLFVPGNLRAQIRIRAVLDDHANVPVNRYSARITINGSVVHDGRLNLEHGVPAGGIFTNWRDLTFNITNQRRVNRVTIVNTSNTGTDDWIAFDWMEIRLLPR